MGMPQHQQHQLHAGQQQHNRGGARGRGGQQRPGGSGFMGAQGSGSGMGDLMAGLQGELAVLRYGLPMYTSTRVWLLCLLCTSVARLLLPSHYCY
jgi:hypothetical protein